MEAMEKRVYVHSCMESHHINRKTSVIPDIGEIVLINGDEKNGGEWRKAKYVRHIQGKEGAVRGVTMLHKGHHIERPLNLVCSLELIGQIESQEEEPATTTNKNQTETRNKRRAAEDTRVKIRQFAEDENEL